MGRVAGYVGALWLVVGCTVSADSGMFCDTDEECGSGGVCDTSVGLCYLEGTEPETDGGTCSPACAVYEACVTSGECRPRFTAVRLTAPDAGTVFGGGTVQVQAQLDVNPTFAGTTQLPETLAFSAARSDDGGVGMFGTVSRSGNTYTVPWTPPGGQARLSLTTAYPDPAAGLSATVNVEVDTVPPVFTLSVPDAPTRQAGSGTQQADQRDPTPGYEKAFRRDESVMVTVTANEPVSSATLTVVGIGAGGGPGTARPPVTLTHAGTCPGAPPFCSQVTVKLSEPEMLVFRGDIRLQVSGQDRVGNSGSAEEPLQVTRWKWAFDANAAISGTPAVGPQGAVYLGTNPGSGQGRVFAVYPNGASKWPDGNGRVGDVAGSLAVGNPTPGEVYVYVASKAGSNSSLQALLGSTGAPAATCPLLNAGEIPGTVAVGFTSATGGAVETGVGLYNASSVGIMQIKPTAPTGEQCIAVSGSGPSAVAASVAGSALVMKEQNIFYGASGSRLTSYDLSTGLPQASSGWPQNTNSLVRGLALVGDQLYGAASNTDDASLGSLFTVPTTGGAISFVYPEANSSRVFNLAIGNGNIAYFGAETASTNELLSLPLGPPVGTLLRASGVGKLRGAPVIGRNGHLYTVNTQGKVSAWTTSTLASLWNIELSLNLAKDVSPTLDCLRHPDGSGANATVGTLYVPGESRLYAFIVDSPGLDPTAPWPKFQRDARNTGNPANPITNCP